MNKVLVRVFFPRIDTWYEVWIPINQEIETIMLQLAKGVNELNDNIFITSDSNFLYNRLTGESYYLNSLVKDTNIKNGTELIFM